jgi:hypothetical protein
VSEVEASIRAVAELDLAYEPTPWPFADARADEIEAHWAQRKAALPRLFNGRVLLSGSHAFARRDDGAMVLRASYFATDYKAFLTWRDLGFPDAKVCNCFSMAALRASDGAFLLGEMAAHTANAGVVYFAAGTPDLNDVVGDRVDLFASVSRELREETGISPDEVEMAPGWTIVSARARVGCMKIMRMAETAERIKARVEVFLAEDAHAELRRMHIVRDDRDIEAINCPRFVADFLRHALRRG